MGFKLVVYPHPFRSDREVFENEPSKTYGEIKEKYERQGFNVKLLYPNGVVDDSQLDLCPGDGEVVIVRLVPANTDAGKKASKDNLGYGIGAFLLVAAALVFTILSYGTASPILFGVLGGLAGAGAGVLGGIYSSSIIAADAMASLPGRTSISDEAKPQIRGARNQLLPYATVPVILGRNYVLPNLVAPPFTEQVGSDQYLRQIFVVGFGPLNIDQADMKIGNTSLSNYSNVEVEILDSTANSSTLYPSEVQEEQPNLQLNFKVPITRSTTMNLSGFSVDITFPGGLCKYDGNMNKSNASVTHTVQYRKSGTSTWTIIYREVTIASTNASFTRTAYWATPAGDPGPWDIMVVRTTSNSNSSDLVDSSYLTSIRQFLINDPIRSDIRQKLVRIALRIKATDQLNGIVDQLSVVARSKIPAWNGLGSGASYWPVAESRNPAAAYLHVLRGGFVSRPIPDAMIDWPTIEAWYSWCAAKGFCCDAVLNSSMRRAEVLNNIASTGRASFLWRDGKYSVLVDDTKTTPIQMFTPRNSKNFIGNKVFRDQPHALKLKFINADQSKWAEDECIVYDDGYNLDGSSGLTQATKFESITLWGVTDYNQAWKIGRYHIADFRLRSETFALEVDIEHIACTRGDLIRVQYDVPLWGVSAGRVKSVTLDGTGKVTSFVSDETLQMSNGLNYGIHVRTPSGPVDAQVVTTEGGVNTVTLTTPTAGFAAGDLFAFGILGSETVDCLVKSIEMGSEMSAKLILINYNSGVYGADSGTIPPFSSYITAPSTLSGVGRPATPAINRVVSDKAVWVKQSNGKLISRILISFAEPSSEFSIDYFDFWYRIFGSGADWVKKQLSWDSNSAEITPAETTNTYQIQIRAVDVGGLTSDWAYTEHLISSVIEPIAGQVQANDSIASKNYLTDYSGWAIDGEGNAEFNNIKARGAFSVNSFITTNNQVLDGFLKSANYNRTKGKGWRFDQAGNAEMLQGIFTPFLANDKTILEYSGDYANVAAAKYDVGRAIGAGKFFGFSKSLLESGGGSYWSLSGAGSLVYDSVSSRFPGYCVGATTTAQLDCATFGSFLGTNFYLEAFFKVTSGQVSSKKIFSIGQALELWFVPDGLPIRYAGDSYATGYFSDTGTAYGAKLQLFCAGVLVSTVSISAGDWTYFGISGNSSNANILVSINDIQFTTLIANLTSNNVTIFLNQYVQTDCFYIDTSSARSFSQMLTASQSPYEYGSIPDTGGGIVMFPSLAVPLANIGQLQGQKTFSTTSSTFVNVPGTFVDGETYLLVIRNDAGSTGPVHGLYLFTYRSGAASLLNAVLATGVSNLQVGADTHSLQVKSTLNTTQVTLVRIF